MPENVKMMFVSTNTDLCQCVTFYQVRINLWECEQCKQNLLNRVELKSICGQKKFDVKQTSVCVFFSLPCLN